MLQQATENYELTATEQGAGQQQPGQPTPSAQSPPVPSKIPPQAIPPQAQNSMQGGYQTYLNHLKQEKASLDQELAILAKRIQLDQTLIKFYTKTLDAIENNSWGARVVRIVGTWVGLFTGPEGTVVQVTVTEAFAALLTPMTDPQAVALKLSYWRGRFSSDSAAYDRAKVRWSKLLQELGDATN